MESILSIEKLFDLIAFLLNDTSTLVKLMDKQWRLGFKMFSAAVVISALNVRTIHALMGIKLSSACKHSIHPETDFKF